MTDAAGENRADVLTGPGAAAIAVVRITGPQVRPFLAAHFSGRIAPQRCVHGQLSDGPAVLDDPVVVLWAGDVAEINLHGGSWVLQSTLDLLQRAGFAIHESSGAASIPLHCVEGQNILEREVYAWLPLARTELAARSLLHQPSAWSKLLARLKSGGDVDIQPILSDRALHHLLHPPTVALIGAPNVGKSTLANQLFAQERAITADLPGTTRDWVGELADIDGLAVMLVDTPGIRDTSDAIEAQAIEHSGQKVRSADLVVHVLDVSMPLEPQQAPLLRNWPAALRVINKVDRAPAWDHSAVCGVQTIGTTGAGLKTLRLHIRAFFGLSDTFDEAAPRWWTRRQRTLLEKALQSPEWLGEILRPSED